MGLLRERGFRLLWIGQFLVILATWAMRTVLLIWVYSLTHSGVAVSLVGLAEGVPLLLLGPVSGVYVDRWNRAYTMAGSAFAMGLLFLPLLAVNSRAGLPFVIVVAVLANSAGQLFGTAAQAAVPVVVGQEKAGEANSLFSVINGVIAVAGPAAAALIFATIGPHGAVIAFALISLLAVPVLALVPAPRAVREEGDAGVWGEMIDGLRYVHRSPLLIALVVVSFVALLGIGALSVLDVVFVTRALHLHSTDVGFLYSASGFGELAGGIVMSILGSRLANQYHRILGVSVIVSAIALMAYALSPALWVAVIALFISGAMFPPLIVSFMTMVQIVTEDAYMGRVNSVITTAIAVAMILSLATGGALADLFGVREVIGAAAALFGVSGVATLLSIRDTPAPRVGHAPLSLALLDCEGQGLRVQVEAHRSEVTLPEGEKVS